MKLNLKDIIEVPGKSVPFSLDMDESALSFPQIVRYNSAPHAEGQVRNSAGVLWVEGEISADMLCVCDRCGREFQSEKLLPVRAVAVAEEENENPEAFTLSGDWLDIDEVLVSAFVLDMETKFLCKEGCKGFCPTCGKDLNEGPCSCGREKDPRLAVLEQLLDDKEN